MRSKDFLCHGDVVFDTDLLCICVKNNVPMTQKGDFLEI